MYHHTINKVRSKGFETLPEALRDASRVLDTIEVTR